MFGLTKDLGIDLGTANTLVYVKDKGIIVREPSVVAINLEDKNVLAVGDQARAMIGRTPGNIVATKPLRDGVIADFDTAAIMMKYFIKQAKQKTKSMFSGKPNVIVCVPSGVTGVEKKAIVEATINAGAKNAYTIEEPFAAAIGADLPIWEAMGSMVVDIGGGTTEIAVISLGGIVASSSIKIAGNALDESVTTYIKRKHSLMIGERSAEQLKMELGSALKEAENQTMEIRGRDIVSGLPKVVYITSHEMTEALTDCVNQIIEAVKATLEKSPPELSSDIFNNGIVLTGGGALLKNLDKRMENEIRVPVLIAENPLDCVAIGTGKALAHIDKFETQQVKRRAN